MIDFIIQIDADRQPSGIIPQSDVIYDLVLTANVEKVVTVPEGADIVLFGTTANFYCRMNATAAVPVGDVLDGSGSELNPSSRQMSGVATIHLISAANCIITLSFYNVPKPVYIAPKCIEP